MYKVKIFNVVLGKQRDNMKLYALKMLKAVICNVLPHHALGLSTVFIIDKITQINIYSCILCEFLQSDRQIVRFTKLINLYY